MFPKKNDRQTQVFLLRHGQSTYNALGLYQGNSDHPILTELGHQQGEKASNFLKNIVFDAIYVSPLQRAQQTSQIVAQTLNPCPPLQTLYDLQETELPLWQGIPFEQVKEQFPEAYNNWKQRPHDFRMELKQENPAISRKSLKLLEEPAYFYPALDLYQRVQPVWQTLLSRHLGQTILIISHSGTNKALISTALGISPAYYHCFEQANCAINLLTFAEGRLTSGQLEKMNQVAETSSLPMTKDGGLRLLFIPKEGNKDESIAKLTALLKNEVINFSISDHHPSSLKITEHILLSHPHTLQFRVLQEVFAELWHKTIYQRNKLNSTELSTGLVVASTDFIQRFIGQFFGLSPCQAGRFSLHDATVSVLYFPNSGELPCLQTLNLSL